jgi:hypothetical protein
MQLAQASLKSCVRLKNEHGINEASAVASGQCSSTFNVESNANLTSTLHHSPKLMSLQLTSAEPI